MCAGLPIELRLRDYRALGGEKFDGVVSIGMFEHVGYKNYRTFMRIVRSCLRPNGVFVLHTIGTSRSVLHGHLWMGKHIFPDAMLPSLTQIARATEGVFVIEDIQNIGSHYDKTLMAWYRNFDRGLETLRETYGDRFYRLWKCYLLSCAGVFRARQADAVPARPLAYRRAPSRIRARSWLMIASAEADPAAGRSGSIKTIAW